MTPKMSVPAPGPQSKQSIAPTGPQSTQGANLAPLAPNFLAPKTPTTSPNPPLVSTSKAANSQINSLGTNINNHVEAINNQANTVKTNAAIKAATPPNPNVNPGTATNAQGLTPAQMSTMAATDQASLGGPTKPSTPPQNNQMDMSKQGMTFDAGTGQWMQKQADGSMRPAQTQNAGTTTTDTTTQGAGASGTPEDHLASLNAQSDQAYSDYTSKIESIQNGTFPLNPTQQATINSIMANFDQLRNAQKDANQNYTNAITQAGITSGRARYAPEIEAGNVMNAVNTGLAKIAKIDGDASTALVNAQTAFQKEDYTEATNMYDELQKHLDAKTTQLQRMMDLSQKAAADAQKQSMDLMKFKSDQEQQGLMNQLKFAEFDQKTSQQAFDNIMTSSKFDYSQKQDAIKNAIESDKFSWQQKQDMIKNALEQGKFSYEQEKDLRNYQLDVQKMQQADTPASYKEWKLSGQNSGYAAFLAKNKVDSKPPTQDQSTAANLVQNMKLGNDVITKLGDKINNMKAADFLVQNKLPTFMQSPDFQQFKQASQGFVEGWLRKTSGAAISDSEWQKAFDQFLPTAGNSPELLAQKARARETVMSGLANEAGSALSDDFRNNIKNVSYTSLDDFANTNKTVKVNGNDTPVLQAIDQMGKDHPNWSDDDILQVLQRPNVGSTFNQPLSKGENGSAPDINRTAEAIGRYESGGRYNALGPVLPSGSYAGDRAYGKYQIMGKNIPSWTKQALGQSMTPQQFLKDTNAQDQTAKYFMQKHLDKYGTVEDVASMWLSGKPASGNSAQDLATGVTVPQYIKNVMKNYNQS